MSGKEGVKGLEFENDFGGRSFEMSMMSLEGCDTYQAVLPGVQCYHLSERPAGGYQAISTYTNYVTDLEIPNGKLPLSTLVKMLHILGRCQKWRTINWQRCH